MWQYTALTYSFSYLEPVHCFMSSSNCCFLTSMQISHEAGKVVWYSHLLKNFPQFLMIHTVKGFSVVNETEVDVFLEFSSFFYDPMDCQAPLSLGFQGKNNGMGCRFLLQGILAPDIAKCLLWAKLPLVENVWISWAVNVAQCTGSQVSNYIDHSIELLRESNCITNMSQPWFCSFYSLCHVMTISFCFSLHEQKTS